MKRLLDLSGDELRRALDEFIQKNPRSAGQNRWSEKEVAILRALYGKVPTKTISKELGRSRRAILNKGGMLGLATPQRAESRE